MIVEKAEDRAMALFGTGYWADHWDYYMDMINVSGNFVVCAVFLSCHCFESLPHLFK